MSNAINSLSNFYRENVGWAFVGAVGGITLLALTVFRRHHVATLSQRVMLRSEPQAKRSVDANWIQDMPSSATRVFAHDTDIGNDFDDAHALTYAVHDYGHQIRLVTTTLYRPEDKARICSLYLKMLGAEKIPVCSGYGAYKGGELDWLQLYPCWPQKFGIPGSSNKVSLLQAKAYRERFAKEFDQFPIGRDTAVDEIIALCRQERQNLVLVSQAPLTNLAHAMEREPGCLDKINRLVMMGGWFDDDKGGIARLGYNTAVDLEASRRVLEQTRFPVLIISSELVKKFTIRDKEREVFTLSPCKTPLGEAASADLNGYLKNKVPAGGELGLADVLTAYVANHPEVIKRTDPVKLTFNPDLLNIDMFHPQSKEVITVTRMDESNIHIIKELHDPEKLRMKLVAELLPLFYLHVLPEEFAKAIAADEAPALIAEKLAVGHDTSERMAKMIAAFCAQLPTDRPQKESPKTKLSYFEYNGKRVFAVHKEDQRKLQFGEVHQTILTNLDKNNGTQIVQVIGDSAPFSQEGTLSAEQYLFSQLNSDPTSLVLWGYTGSRKGNGRRMDANALVSKWVNQAPFTRADRVMANIVDEHTPAALKDWGAQVTPFARNFFLVYGNAKFGDDVISSDSITDKAFCLEGGVQAFKQIVNFLTLEIPVEGIYGLRMEKNPVNYDSSSEAYLHYFSATEFLFELFQKIEQIEKGGKKILAQEIEQFKEAYLKEKHLFNPRRPDGGTKQALFESAWKSFMDQRLWERRELCQFRPVSSRRAAL